MKLAIVTGGSKGLGKALFHSYESDNWEVYDFSREGREDNSIPVDFNNTTDLLNVAEGLFTILALKPWREIHFISNAASIDPIAPLIRCNPIDVEAHIRVNITSPLLFIRSFLVFFSHMKCKKCIAHISSGAALHGRAGWSLYTLSKAGMENAIRSISLEQAYASHPTTCVLIDPGVMNTNMQARIRESNPGDMADREKFVALKERGGLAEPALIAEAVREILSDNPVSGERYDARIF